MNSVPLDHHGAFLVQAEDLDDRAFAAELEDSLVERTHRRDIPEVRPAHIDHHPVEHFLVIESFHEPVGGGEEHLPLDAIGAGCPVR